MPAEIISLLSSPSVGPSPAPVAPAQSRPAEQAATVVAAALTYSDDVFDLTADSPEPIPDSTRKPTIQDGQRKSTYSPRSISGSKRAREEHPVIDPPVYFMSDDFDSTIDLDSSLPPKGGTGFEERNFKRPRLSSTTHGGNETAPLKQSGALRRAQVLDDPIEFSSSPGLPPRPTTNSTMAKVSQSIESDDPFASSPPPVRPAVEQQKPSTTTTTTTKPAAASVSRIEYDLTSDADDPFASSPRHPPPKPTSDSHTITLDDDDDDDPFASRSIPGASKPQSPKLTTTSIDKGKQKAASPKRRANWDPISSSAPERHLPSDPFSPPPRRTLTKSASYVIDLSDAESEQAGFDPNPNSDDEFPDLDNFDATRLKRRLENKKTNRKTASTTTKATNTKSTTARATTKKSADDRARDKEEKAAEREREKEHKKQEKEAAKEQKARDKERAAALAEVNKIRTDKKVSTPEMIAVLPSSLPAAVTLQIQTLLKDLDVQHEAWDSPVDNVVKWKRKVASRFNDELGHWEPIPMRVEADKYALVVVNASEFVSFAQAPEGSDLETHVLRMKRHFPTEQLIYLIEGLTPWMRKNRNLRNRQFASAVRNQSAEPAEPAAAAAQPRRRKNQQPQEYVDEDSIEDALLELQVMHGVLIHHTNAAVETAQWVAIFTQHISTVPYRKQREAANAAGAGFCMETGQVRTGEDVKDTYVRMLQEIARVTAPIAWGIATKFETVPKLVKGMEEGGPLILENLRKSTNKDGGFSDRAVGKSVSKRVYKVFTGRDEWSTDV